MSPRRRQRATRESVRLSASMFYKYLRCPHWVYWDVHGDQKEQAPVSSLMERIWRHGIVHEEKAMKARYPGAVEIPEYGDSDELFTRTVQAMAAGARSIQHGRLIDGRWIGIPDVLVREELPAGRRSRFGSWIYVPHDIKSAHIKDPDKDIRAEYKFQLAFYALILEKIQGVRPEYGYIVDAAFEPHAVRMNEVMDAFHLTLRDIEKIMSGHKPPPFLASACKESPWFALCKREAMECDDVCLIYKIRRAEHAKLYEAGIRTVTELANMDLDTLEAAVTDMSRRKLEAIQRQARALYEKKVIVIQSPSFPVASTEVYFDIEGDPLRRLEYLFGLLVVSGKGGSAPGGKGPRARGTYHRFLAETPEGEEGAWHEFLSFVRTLPEDAAIYHYGTYEKAVVERLTKRYGGDARAIERLETRMVNLLTTVCESVALPVYFYSLKDIARELGFKWRHKSAGGANSITWYEEYLEQKGKKGGAARAKRLLKDIIDYNEDDVRATLHLKRWLAKLPEPA